MSHLTKIQQEKSGMMMNLKILEQENPPLSAIREIAEGGEEALGALVRLLEPITEETAEGEPPEYIACAHAIRILGAKQDPRVIALVAAVIDYHTRRRVEYRDH